MLEEIGAKINLKEQFWDIPNIQKRNKKSN